MIPLKSSWSLQLKAWARAFAIGFVVGIAMYSERGRTQSIINVTHLQLESKNVIWSINCKGKQSFRYELKQWNCKNIAITWCIVIAREQEKKMSRNIGCTIWLNRFASKRDVSPGVLKLLCIKTIGKQTHIQKSQNGSWQ